MNKQQKKNLVKARRFQQRVNVLGNKLLTFSIDTETGGLSDLEIEAHTKYEVNMDLLRKLTMKELAFMIDDSQEEGVNEVLLAALNAEYAERQLLLEKKS